MAKAQKNRPPFKKRPSLPTIEVEIDHINDEGIGIARHKTKEVWIVGAMQGERVVAAVEHEGQRRIVGRLKKILKRSSKRITSPCQKSHDCQGCPLIQMSGQAQLHFKEQKVTRALTRYPALKNVEIHPIWKAPHNLGYRTNAKLVIGKERGKVKIGLYRRGTHEIVDIGECPLHHPLINKIVRIVREEVERQGVFVYNPIKKTGLLRYLAIKITPAFDKAMVTFITTERNYRETIHLAKWLKKKIPEVISIHQNVNPSGGNVIFGRQTLKMLGTPDLIDQVGEVRLRISPTSFFQVNNEQAARIYEQVRQWAKLSKNESAVDLYCGIGGIALNMARDAGKVIGIEVVEEAVRNAIENARMNELGNCSFRAGDVAELVHDLAMKIPPGSVAVVNPPRSGCDERVLHALGELEPRTLIYVSCNPETLGRDLNQLHALGYQTHEVQPVDMFPQTPHVESIAHLVPQKKTAKPIAK